MNNNELKQYPLNLPLNLLNEFDKLTGKGNRGKKINELLESFLSDDSLHVIKLSDDVPRKSSTAYLNPDYVEHAVDIVGRGNFNKLICKLIELDVQENSKPKII